MKKLMITLSIVIFAGVCYGVYTTGKGAKGTASTSPAEVSGLSAGSLSLYNADDADDIFAMVNCTTSVFATALAAGTTVPVPPGASYTFDTKDESSIHNIWLATTNGTAGYYIGSF